LGMQELYVRDDGAARPPSEGEGKQYRKKTINLKKKAVQTSYETQIT